MEKYLNTLYKLVKDSFDLNEIPVGAIIIYKDKIIGKGINNRQSQSNVCGHAEINAILDAEKYIKDWRLNECILISTLHPCKMCQQVIEESRISKVFYLIDQKECNNSKYSQIYFPGNKYYEEINKIFLSFFKKLR